MEHEKICKTHGELAQENIIVEPNKSAKRGYTLRCRLCKLEKDRRWKDDNREQHNLSATRKRNEDRKLYREGLVNLEPKANTWEREDRKKNPEKYRRYEQNYINKHGRIKVRKMEVARNHGLTFEQYEELFEIQDYHCKICGKEETRKGVSGDTAPLCVDHCHLCRDNGHLGLLNVRGLLCHECNKGLGGFQDDITLLQKAIEYLKRHEHTG